MSNIVYLHGFASSPQSRKAGWFGERLQGRGHRVLTPQLDGGEFRNMTVSSMAAIVSETLGAVGQGETVLMGSSLGGYLAALYGALYPERVHKLILMAPAFGFAQRWLAELGEEASRQWRESGYRLVPHYALGEEAAIGWGLIDDALVLAEYPEAAQPSLVLHGRGDTVVPLEASEEWCRRGERRRLAAFDAGHELTEALEPMWAEVESFLAGH